jgi:hypothetical protein
MPFSVKLTLGADSPITFDGWLEDSFDKGIPKGTAFAKANSPSGPGFIITNFPVFLSSGATLTVGAIPSSGDVIAYGGANGEDIPYGKPYCVFVPAAPPE